MPPDRDLEVNTMVLVHGGYDSANRWFNGPVPAVIRWIGKLHGPSDVSNLLCSNWCSCKRLASGIHTRLQVVSVFEF